jgi:HrpA-like RNA helicase
MRLRSQENAMTTSSEYVKGQRRAGKEILPIENFKARLLACNAPYIIVEAETGSGKSTMVPWWMFEMGHRVLVTEPLIESVVGTSEFVAGMMGVELGTTVGYRTAAEKRDCKDTQILYVTDGLALVRALAGHNQFDVLVIDELHQWTTNQSTLEAWAWKLLQSGKAPFKRIVVLSATLDSSTLSKKRGNAPVFKIPGRQFEIIDRAPGVSIEADIRQLVQEGYDVLCFQPTQMAIQKCLQDLAGLNAELIPFHGRLSREEKNRAYVTTYARPKVIISTNALETGRTVQPNRRRKLAVVDSGLERRNELVNGIEGSFIRAISIAQEGQRRGRTGRVGEGLFISHCPDTVRDIYPVPEMLRTQLSSSILRLAIAGFDASDLPFFHELPEGAIEHGKRSLVALGAFNCRHNVTRLGEYISRLPVDVHIGRMIMEAARLGVVGDILVIAACMTVGGIRDNTKAWRRFTRETFSDALAERDIFWKIVELGDDLDFLTAGVYYNAFSQARHLLGKLDKAAWNLGIDTRTTGDRLAIFKALSAGMVNNLFKVNEQRDYTNPGNSTPRHLYHKSVVRRRMARPQWVIGQPLDLELQNKKGELRTHHLLTMATGADPNFLIAAAPHLVSSMRRKYRFDDTTQTVRCELVLVFNEHEIDFAEIEVNCDFDEEGRRLWDAEMQSQLARSDELAWKSFRRSHGDRAVRVRGLMPLPSLPAPTIYDRRSRAVAYPALELRSGTWSVTWFRSKADADASQAAVSKAKTLLDEREEQRRAESGHHIKAAQKQPAQRSGRRARRALAARKDDCSMESRLLQLAATFSKR